MASGIFPTATCTCIRFMAVVLETKLDGFSLAAPRLCRIAGRCRRTFVRRRSAAAVFSEVAEQRVHSLKARGIDHGPALAPDAHKPRRAQAVEMKCQGVGRDP